jgi:hypothetical protein
MHSKDGSKINRHDLVHVVAVAGVKHFRQELANAEAELERVADRNQVFEFSELV